MTKWALFDLEADGLNPTKIYCIAIQTEKGSFSTSSYDHMRKFFSSYDVYIGHNIQRFDIPVVERILGIKTKARLVDTLALSWYLFPTRKRHGLAEWGEEFGRKKPEIDDWYNLPIEEYIHRCEEDVQINYTLWENQLKILNQLYPDPKKFWEFLKYLEFKMDCAREQEEEQWKLDVEFCRQSLKELEDLKEEKFRTLQRVMPPVPIKKKKSKPKSCYKQDGSPSAHGEKWFKLLKEHNLPDDYDGEIEIINGYETPNPNSHTQIKDWLFSLGWEPQTFKYNKEDDGSTRAIPQLNKIGEPELCDSVQELFEKEPNLRHFEGYFVLNHRIGLLSGFLRDNRHGYLQAKIAGLTNTLRFKHAEIVNLPRSGRLYWEKIRGCLIADEGEELCGSDQSSLEDRLKQHYIYPYDPDYVDSMNKPGFDPHLDLAVLGGALTEEQSEAYKNGDKSNKKIRDTYKTTNYACQYGAGPPKLSLTCKISLPDAKKLHATYWKRNWAVKQAAEDQKVIEIDGQLWLVNPVNGFCYSLRNPKDKFSTLVQGTASYVFDVWVGFLRAAGLKLTASFHDEVVIKVKTSEKERCTEILKQALDKANDFLHLNRKLDIDIQYGHRYSQIH